MDDPRAARLLDFIREYLLGDATIALTVDTPLLSQNLVDSVGLVLLAAFIEEQFEVPFEPNEMAAGQAETVRGLLVLIDRR